ncbi:MAG: hypothetical protein KatS3mg031_0103 [Chitinophagales bacterium]|nr:MAG: hypothetical protein KatS3mg031_0103 [Chitinophagales bacterium]
MMLKLVCLIGFLSFPGAGHILLNSELEKIALAIQTGNSRELARYLDNSVEITIYEKEETYSKVQAEMVLKDFFTRNKPLSFKIIHNGSSNQGAQYAIGTLTTDKGTFRTYLYLKLKGQSLLIQEIRFERD